MRGDICRIPAATDWGREPAGRGTGGVTAGRGAADGLEAGGAAGWGESVTGEVLMQGVGQSTLRHRAMRAHTNFFQSVLGKQLIVAQC